MDRNQSVLTSAFKKAKAKIKRIQELGIRADMTEDEIEEVVVALATAKALENEGKTVKDYLDGQQWYVESLVKAAGLTGQELLDSEYEEAFADNASEDEMLTALNALRTKPAESEESIKEPEADAKAEPEAA
jgi:hypothetical protein